MDKDYEIEIERRLTKLEVQTASLPEIQKTLEGINTKLTRYETKWGTFTMVGAAIWALLLLFKDNIMGWFR